MEAFHEYHIPKGIMEIKAEEFRSIRQGPMIVNQYIQKFMKLARMHQMMLIPTRKSRDALEEDLMQY